MCMHTVYAIQCLIINIVHIYREMACMHTHDENKHVKYMHMHTHMQTIPGVADRRRGLTLEHYPCAVTCFHEVPTCG